VLPDPIVAIHLSFLKVEISKFLMGKSAMTSSGHGRKRMTKLRSQTFRLQALRFTIPVLYHYGFVGRGGQRPDQKSWKDVPQNVRQQIANIMRTTMQALRAFARETYLLMPLLSGSDEEKKAHEPFARNTATSAVSTTSTSDRPPTAYISDPAKYEGGRLVSLGRPAVHHAR
jgi:hypothetical protein